MKKSLYSLSIITVFMSSAVFADKFNAEVKGEYETWSSGIGGQSTALLYGAGLAYHQDKLFYGGGFVLGDYSMDSDTGKDLSRMDVDLVAGYRLDHMWSAFAGYRFNQMSYTSKSGTTDFDENTHGLGGGVALNQVLNAQWVAFGSAALSLLTTETEYKDDTPSDPGTGFSLGVEGGTLYRINKTTNTALRIKYQTTRINYDDSGVEWPHSYVRFGVSLNHSF